MSGLDKDRFRNKTISFRVSPEEARRLEARIKVCGMPKGEYFIQSLLYNNISIVVGKYQSDRLSLELRRLKDELYSMDGNIVDDHANTLLEECKALLDEIQKITVKNDRSDELKMADFLLSSKYNDKLHSSYFAGGRLKAGKGEE